MNDWTDGYVNDIPYTYGYFNAFNPLRVKLALLNAGLAAPDIRTACELGFGQGMSVNLIAAASGTEWHGTDFNPAQAAFAQEVAAASGSGAQLHEDAFADFCIRTDLPDFDFIGLHGIWSWVNTENRAIIVDFIRRKLKPGGVVYLGYNTSVGWAALAPLRDLLASHAETMSAPGTDIGQRMDAALDFAEKLLATNTRYGRANPNALERLKHMKKQDRHYLVHEFLNRDWEPMNFSDAAQMLDTAKLTYGCSSALLHHIDALNLTGEQQAILRDISDLPFRENVRDMMTNNQFRRDYWVKGARKLSSQERLDALRAMRFMLLIPRNKVTFKAKGALGEGALHENVHAPIVDFLADHQPRSFAEIEQAAIDNGAPATQAQQAILTLTGAGNLTPVQDDATIEQTRPITDKLNRHLLERARYSSSIGTLSSPVTGGGASVDRTHQLFLLARTQGHATPAEWGAFAQQAYTAQNQGIQKGKESFTEPEALKAELIRQAEEFAEARLPLLETLRVT